MRRIMLLPSPPSSGSIGSVTKCLGIAEKLEQKNCKVCFVIGGQLKKFIEEKGYYAYDYPVPIPRKTMIDIQSAVDFIDWTGMAEVNFSAAAVKAELEAIKDFKPDVIFAETRLSAAISAEIAGIPTVMIASWPITPDFPQNRMHQGRLEGVYNKILKKYHLPEIENITELFYQRATVKIAPTIPELEPDLDRQKIKFVGYILDEADEKQIIPEWYAAWKYKKKIFVYLSVGALAPDLYMQVIADTFKDSAYGVVCGCGFHYSISSLSSRYDNIKFERYFPVASIMHDTNAVIFHGGQDTMLTTLIHGVPSLTIPGSHFEREYNARNLEKLGVSKKLSITSFRPTKLLNEVDKILSQPYITKGMEMKQKMKKYNGTEECVKIIYQL